MDPLDGHEDHDVEATKPPPQADQVRMMQKFAARFATEDEATLRRGYTGVYDCTPDYQPALGKVAAVPGLYVAAGFSGHGFKLSPGIGHIMGELIVNDRETLVDITPFRVERFAAGQLIEAGDAYSVRSLS